MPNAKHKSHKVFQCLICEVSFPTKQEQEDHLRLHCVLCKVLFETRNELLKHMNDEHPREAGVPYWPLSGSSSNPAEDDRELSKDESDVIEYKREHLE